MKRCLIILVFVLLILLIASQSLVLAESQTVVWRMATKMPSLSPEGKCFKLFSDEIARLSDGKMEILLYPSEQLGAVSATLDMLSKGTIHLYPESLTFAHVWVPEVTLAGLPFGFRDRDHWGKFMSSPMAQQWKKQLEEETGISYLGKYGDFLRGPYRVLVSTRPILSLSDVKGLKLRMYKNEVVMKIWEELGAQVIGLPYTEVYQGMRTGLIEAVTTSLSGVRPMHFEEVGKYILRTNEFPQSIVFYINLNEYNALSDDLKQVVQKAYKAACDLSWEIISKAGTDDVKIMVQQEGVKFIEAPMNEFQAVAFALYEKWEAEEKYGFKPGTMDYINNLK